MTRAHVREHEISTVDLATELDIDHIDCHLARRQLRYAGHVARMPLTRLPRRMLSAWVPRRRPVGAPAMTYGRALRSQLEWFGVDIRRWSELAADRGAWRKMLQDGTAPPEFRPPPPLSQRKPRRRAAAAATAAMDGMRGADEALMRRIRIDPRASARRTLFHVHPPTAWSNADRSNATVPDPVERMSAMERAHCPWGA